jgi:hypothetical protein
MNDLDKLSRLLAPGLRRDDGQRIELTSDGDLALPGGDFLQVGDSALLFWHRGRWRRGQVNSYGKDTPTGVPIARVTLRAVDGMPGLPAETIDVRAGDWAMREPLTTKAADDDDDGDIDFVGDMTTEEFASLVKTAVQRALQKAMEQVNAPKSKPAVTTKETKRITNSPQPGVTYKG